MKMETIAKVAKVFQRIWEYISNNRLISGLILALLSLLFTCIVVFIPELKLKQAQKALDAGYTERANDMFAQILLEHYDNNHVRTEALAGRAEIYLNQKAFGRAIQYANKAIENNEYNGDAYYIRGMAYSLRGEPDKAIEDFSVALEHGTKRKEDTYLYRGIEYYSEKRNYDKAIADFNALLKINPKSILGLSYRGMAYFDKKEYDLTIADFNTVLKISPKSISGLAYRGLTYIQKKDYDLAIADYTKVLEIDPNATIFYLKRGLAYEAKGEYAHVIADYTRAMEIEPNNTLYYSYRGSTYYDNGDYDLAIADYTKALEIKPNNAGYYYSRGDAYSANGDYDLAIADFTKALEIDPNDEDSFFYRAIVYWRQGDYNRAIEDCNRTLEIRQDYAMTLDHAETDIKTALNIDHNRVTAQMFLDFLRMQMSSKNTLRS